MRLQTSPKLSDGSLSAFSRKTSTLLVGVAAVTLAAMIGYEIGSSSRDNLRMRVMALQEMPKSSTPSSSSSIGISNSQHFLPRTRTIKCPRKTTETLKPHMLAQQEEDVELLNRFNGVCGGTYIEMGALDGKLFSNTYVFNKQFDWRGVLIELTPNSFAKLGRNRPNELARVQAGVCRVPTKLHYVEKGAISGIWEFSSPEFRRQWWDKAYWDSPAGLPEVECLPLQTILERHIPRRQETDHYFFDILSLDVEGAEWRVLQSIDWDRTAFGVMVVESAPYRKLEFDGMVAYLEKQGYSYVEKIRDNVWFIHKDSDEIYKHLTV